MKQDKLVVILLSWLNLFINVWLLISINATIWKCHHNLSNEFIIMFQFVLNLIFFIFNNKICKHTLLYVTLLYCNEPINRFNAARIKKKKEFHIKYFIISSVLLQMYRRYSFFYISASFIFKN